MIVIIMIHRIFSIIGNPLSNPKRIESVSHENIFETELPRIYKKQYNRTLALIDSDLRYYESVTQTQDSLVYTDWISKFRL